MLVVVPAAKYESTLQLVIGLDRPLHGRPGHREFLSFGSRVHPWPRFQCLSSQD